jgi:hypothetical protein
MEHVNAVYANLNLLVSRHYYRSNRPFFVNTDWPVLSTTASKNRDFNTVTGLFISPYNFFIPYILTKFRIPLILCHIKGDNDHERQRI